MGYGVSTLLQGVVAFVSVPLLIGLLGGDAFARWAILEPVLVLSAMCALLGASHGHIRALAQEQATAAAVFRLQARHGVLPALLVAVLVASAALGYFEFERPWRIGALLVVYVMAEAVIALAQAVARGESDAMTYAATVWLKFGSLAVLLVALTSAGMRLSLEHYIGLLLAIDLVVIASIAWRQRRRAVRPAPAYEGGVAFVAAVRYGAPIVGAAILGLIATNGDRYVVNELLQSSELARYVTMAKLASAIAFAAAPVNLWWPAARFRHARDADGGSAFYRSASFVLLLYYLAALGVIWSLAPAMMQTYAPGIGGYRHSVMLVLLSAAVAAAMVTPLNVGTLNQGKTHWAIWAVLVSALVSLASAIVLTPRLGMLGAAVGNLAGQCVNLLFIHLISQRIHPLAYRYFDLFALLAGFGLATAACLWLQAGPLSSCAVLLAYVGVAGLIGRRHLQSFLAK